MTLSHINGSALARRTGVAQPVINRLITGKNINPKLATLRPLANYFMVTVSQLIGEEELPSNYSFDHQTWDTEQWHFVPLIAWKDALTWPKAITRYRKPKNTTYVPTDAKVSQHAYALTLVNFLMEPLFAKDTVIIADPARKPQHGLLVIAHMHDDNDAHLRQLLNDNGTLLLTPLHPDLDEFGKTPSHKYDQILATVVQVKREPLNKTATLLSDQAANEYPTHAERS